MRNSFELKLIVIWMACLLTTTPVYAQKIIPLQEAFSEIEIEKSSEFPHGVEANRFVEGYNNTLVTSFPDLELVCVYDSEGNKLWEKRICAWRPLISKDGNSIVLTLVKGIAGPYATTLFDRSGRVLWSVEYRRIVPEKISPSGKYVIANDANGRYEYSPAMISGEDGSILWSKKDMDVGQPFGMRFVDDERIVCYDRWNMNLYMFDSSTGNTIWKLGLRWHWDFRSPPGVYIIDIKSSEDGSKIVLHLGTIEEDIVFLLSNRGDILWKKDFAGIVALDISQSGSFILLEGKELKFLRSLDCEEIWEFGLRYSSSGDQVVVRDDLIVLPRRHRKSHILLLGNGGKLDKVISVEGIIPGPLAKKEGDVLKTVLVKFGENSVKVQKIIGKGSR